MAAPKSHQIVGRNPERIFTTEVTEITEINQKQMQRFGNGMGTTRQRL